MDLTSRSSALRPLLLALYPVAIAFILPSLLEWVLVGHPFRPGQASWRFGTVGLLYNNVAVSPLFGFAIAAIAATLLEQRGVLRTVAVLCGVLAAVLLVTLPFFALDFVQLRAGIAEERRRAFDLLAAKATVVALIMAVTAIAVGLATWRAAGRLPGAERAARAARPGHATSAASRS